MDTTLTPTDLFSPSKARQQRAQARDWSHIDSWLASKYACRSIPTFERNDETLKALRAVALANERADEEQRLLEKVEREALAELESAPDNPSDTLLTALTTHLPPTGAHSLTALATTSIHLNTPSTDPSALAHALITHTTTSHSLTTTLHHLRTLHTALSTTLSDLRNELHALRAPAYTVPATLPRQTADRARVTKQLRAKQRECETALAELSRATTTPKNGQDDVRTAAGLAVLEARERELLELRARVVELEAQVQEFRGLPMEKEGARREVRRAEGELEALLRRRDGMFEGLVG
ncbi:uncharacterized protein BDZ99DRAFT_230717 [Mytilinidion resinicola]|uniref:HAUS augmin-like complex subunit 1 n=1 Tax=Mytilinidion resinicola TaxID=574789 RepID=A0A6A6YZU8_9PEZI|nr:uncharacterized protein BDZ99DRAFT_230717 [Mytilinidion resinicola]KAF2814058.1 hypothetical protein BDZ99DRAFT_230717 [Mytilinidion resinicola]